MCARAGQVLICAVGVNDRLRPLRSQSLDVGGRIFDIDVGSHGRLLLHEAKIPVRNIVPIEPLNRLAHCHLVEVFDEQPVRNDADPYAFGTELSLQ